MTRSALVTLLGCTNNRSRGDELESKVTVTTESLRRPHNNAFNGPASSASRMRRQARADDGPRTYYAPDCLFPAASDDEADRYVQGLTNGWADIYDWYIPDQYLEVTGVSSCTTTLRSDAGAGLL